MLPAAGEASRSASWADVEWNVADHRRRSDVSCRLISVSLNNSCNAMPWPWESLM